MKIETLPKVITAPIPKKLSTVHVGDVFRMAETSFSDAMGDGNQGFYMRIQTTTSKSDRVSLISLDGKTLMERDEDRLVYVHNAKVQINPEISI
jgi:hypothetical protein